MSEHSDPEMELLVQKWRAHLHSFPQISGSIRDEIDDVELKEIQDLHGDLVEWDAYNAGLVSKVLNGRKIRVLRIGPNRRLESKIDRLLSRYPKHSSVFMAYRREYDDMLELIELASRVNRRR